MLLDRDSNSFVTWTVPYLSKKWLENLDLTALDMADVGSRRHERRPLGSKNSSNMFVTHTTRSFDANSRQRNIAAAPFLQN